MGDKKSFDELFGKLELFIGEGLTPIGHVVENSLIFPDLDMKEDAAKMVCNSFAFSIPVASAPKTLWIDADYAAEPSVERCSLVIQGKETINKPRNLKHPNKKRARRIWKKWKRRFGTIPGKNIVLSDVKVEHKGNLMTFTAKPAK